MPDIINLKWGVPNHSVNWKSKWGELESKQRTGFLFAVKQCYYYHRYSSLSYSKPGERLGAPDHLLQDTCFISHRVGHAPPSHRNLKYVQTWYSIFVTNVRGQNYQIGPNWTVNGAEPKSIDLSLTHASLSPDYRYFKFFATESSAELL